MIFLRVRAIAFALTVGAVLSLGSASAQESPIDWKSEPVPAQSEASKNHKAVLAFFHSASSKESGQLLSTLSQSKVSQEIQASYIPLMIDTVQKKALAAQLGISQPGVIVVYSHQGSAIAAIKQEEVASAEALAMRLHSIASENGYLPAAAPASTSTPASGTAPSLAFALPSSAAVPVVAAPTASGASGTAEPTAGANTSQPSDSKFEPFESAVGADDIVRDQLGNQITVTGKVVVSEPSTAPNRPYILLLSKRAQDALQVVYWPATAEQIHAGRRAPKEGDLVSVRGKLTDYRGKLQIKVEQADQMRYAPLP